MLDFWGLAFKQATQDLRSKLGKATPPAGRAQWRNPEDVKASHPRASILKGGRVVFNIKGNDYRLIAELQHQAGVLAIRFFCTHAEYDRVDA